MRRNTHILFSLIIGVLAFLLIESLKGMTLPQLEWLFPWDLIRLKHLFVLLIASTIGGILPDIFDPPYTHRHRGIAHSKFLLFVMLLAWSISLYSLLESYDIRLLFIYFFLSGYISHLLLDSTTPSGLK